MALHATTSHLKGARQGCPFSAYLLIIVIEVQANNICNDTNIKDINADNKEIKISLLADHTTLILNEISNLLNIH